jgi:hypothetical protein
MSRSMRPLALSHDLICIEAAVGEDETGVLVVSVLMSIPGRDGTQERRWACPGGSLSLRTAEDLTAWVQVSLIRALEVRAGLQLQFPLGDEG